MFRKTLSIFLIISLIIQVSYVTKPENSDDSTEIRISDYKANDILATINKASKYFQETFTATLINWDDAVYANGNTEFA